MTARTKLVAHPFFGKCLFAEKGGVEIGIPLGHGIRIAYLSYKGSGNLFFEQPSGMTDLTTPAGWRIYGGHRLWIAPECKEIYYPDNEPISCEITGGVIVLRQKEDPWIKAEKTVEISFLSDNALKLNHVVKNTGAGKRTFSIWPVTSVAPGGTERIPLHYAESGSAPLHRITTWYYTSLGDGRAEYKRDLITLTHKASGQRYKIGVGHPAGPVTYTNKGVVFEKAFEISKDGEYPDGNVSYETYMCDHMVELESLSPLYTVDAGQSAEYEEIWTLKNQVQ